VSGEVDYLTLSTATRNWKAILHFYLDELGMDFWNARLFRKIAKEAEQMTESKKPLFREMRRFKQQISEAECLRILQEEKRGVLSVLGDDDYPYGMPINHYYCEEDGRLYFHTGMKGHRTDSIRRHDKVSFCVYDSGYRREGEWALNIRSVIVFGRVEIIEDRDKIYEIARKLSHKFPCDEEYIEREIRSAGPRTFMFALVPEYMTGKLVNEA
jgi:nitroimidazol reductase NimA-like FMN-containing flavoprotein (pyridoxamine 5'-phosphate oxidase superfamily)